jgi:sphingomyelin phosphodiesterase acid-like 3
VDGATAPVVMLSDIHFDPFRDPAKVLRLTKAPVEEWQKILDAPDSADQAAQYAAMQTACGGEGDDTDETLLNAALGQARNHEDAAGFVTVSGDLLVHKLDCRLGFATKAKGTMTAAKFSVEIANYVIARVEDAFPKEPVYFALGNNDSSCGDYRLNVHDSFLIGTSEGVLRGLRGADAEELKQAKADYETGGYYGVTLAGAMRKVRLLVVDDMYESTYWQGCDTAGDAKPQRGQTGLHWLNGELDKAREGGEKVWVMGHIPPGPDVYNTMKHLFTFCSKPPVMFLSSTALVDELVRHAAEVQLALFAHTHEDELRLLERPDEKGAVAMKLVPSISPIHANLPAFTVAKVEVDGAVRDYTVYAASDMRGDAWDAEYSFDATYGVQEFSARTVRRLVGALQTDKVSNDARSKAYERFYSVGGGGAALRLVWPQYGCALTLDRAEDFMPCLCPAKAQ